MRGPTEAFFQVNPVFAKIAASSRPPYSGSGFKLQATSRRRCDTLHIAAGDWIKYIKIKQKGYNMDASAEQLKRIADAVSEILRLVKEDMDRSKQHYEKENNE